MILTSCKSQGIILILPSEIRYQLLLYNVRDVVYFMQMQSPTWQKTTAYFKQYYNKIMNENGWW